MLKLLLIEDDERLAKVMCMLLDKKDVITYYAQTLKQAIEILTAENISLIILDLGLPDAKKLESFVILQKQFPTAPILVFTGLQGNELIDGVPLRQAIENNGGGFIEKPITSITLLFDAIDKLLKPKSLDSQFIDLKANLAEAKNLVSQLNGPKP